MGSTTSSDFPAVNARYPELWGGSDAFITKFDSFGQGPVYSTYLGGRNECSWLICPSFEEMATAIATDTSGNAYVVGWTTCNDFPTVNARYPSIPCLTQDFCVDAFLTKFDPSGQGPIYSTYLGGGSGYFAAEDLASGVAVDSVGNVYVVGYTSATDFPQVDPFDSELGDRGYYDAFVTKFDPAGQGPVYSSYLGGSNVDSASSIAVDGAGHAYVAGSTGSQDFPTFNPRYPKLWGNKDAFVTKIADTTPPAATSLDLEFLDARDFRSGSDISADPAVLGSTLLGHPMVGVATDGVAQLLLRARTNRPGTLTFSLDGTKGTTGHRTKDGFLISRDGADVGSTHTVAVEPIGDGNGDYYAFARYRAPATFPRSNKGADLSAAERQLQLKATFEPSDGGRRRTIKQPLLLARPPVILIHGVNSDSATWETFQDNLRDRIPGLFINAEFGDYRSSNKASFSVNQAVPLAATIRAANAYRDRYLAVAQVDVFGHSMGGILSRIAASDARYRRDSNYHQGDFNRLITVDSPHHGSPWADLVWPALASAWGGTILSLFGVPSGSYLDALEDLQTGSAALCDMLSEDTDVPAHVVVGNYVPTVDDLADLACIAMSATTPQSVLAMCKAWRLLRLAGFDTGVSTNFPLGGDLVVGTESQRDGFDASDGRVFEQNHIHMAFADRPWALGTDAVADQAVVLLNASPADPSLFGVGFPRSSCKPRVASDRSAAPAEAGDRAAATEGLSIVQPADGATVTTGEVVTVTVRPDSDLAIERLMLTSLGDLQELANPPWTFDLTLPDSVVGPFPIVATGKDATGNLYTARIQLNVVAPSPLRTLSITPSNVMLTRVDLPQSLAVVGNYEDGARRDLTGATIGTRYTTRDTSVATVDADGRITAVGNGNTRIGITHGSVSAEIPVVVRMETDLAIEQTALPDLVAPGEAVTYGLKVTNQGSEAAQDIEVEDRLPLGSGFIAISAPGWSCLQAGGVVRCSRAALAPREAGAIAITADAPQQTGLFSNIAAVRASTDDGNAENNIVTLSLQVEEDGDHDGDGIPDSIDPDDDNDGIADWADPDPLNDQVSISPVAAPSHAAQVDHRWSDIDAPSGFVEAVVIAGPPTAQGDQPGVVRLRRVTDRGFKLRFQPWGDPRGEADAAAHTEEAIPYLLLASGRHQVSDGSLWEAGKFRLGGTGKWQAVSFRQPLAAPPVLLLTIQTAKDKSAVAVRARKVTATGFEAALFEEEAQMDGHGLETVGYLAIQSSAGSGLIDLDGVKVPYLLQEFRADERWTPVLGQRLKVEEETSEDPEIDHPDETLQVLALADQLFAQQVSHRDADPTALRRLAPTTDAPMEWGLIRGIDHRWQTLPFAKRYQDPILVVKPVSNQDAEPGVIRLRGRRPTHARVRYQEWDDYLDGTHPPEDAFYIVSEAGRHRLGGLRMEANWVRTDKLGRAGEWERVDFARAFPGRAGMPIILGSVMTTQGKGAVATRIRTRGLDGFELSLEKQESKPPSHVKEVLGWIAVQPGGGVTTDGRRVDALVQRLGHTLTPVAYPQRTDHRHPTLLADVNSAKEPDAVFLRYAKPTRIRIQLKLAEEQSKDKETRHARETVGVLIAE